MGQLNDWGGGGVGIPNIPKDIVAGPFYYAEPNGSKF
jgi:hypothetical protein